MTQKEIKQKQKRIEKIWDEMTPTIEGTGISSLIEELVELEIELTAEEGQ
jgi:hypothetical protein